MASIDGEDGTSLLDEGSGAIDDETSGPAPGTGATAAGSIVPVFLILNL